jgi:hypothetical protein
VQVKNKRERSIPVGLQVWSRQVGLVRGTLWPTGSSAGRMVARTTSEVVDSFLVESQNQGRAGMTWGASHEWRLGGGVTPSPPVSNGSPQNHWVPLLIHKTKTVD